MIEIKNLNKKYGNQTVLQDINLQFETGQAVAMIGPNGAGKTTLIKIILGLAIPLSGSIHIDGLNIIGQSNYRKNIGYMPQISRFPDHLKVEQLFTMLKSLRNDVPQSGYDLELYEEYKIAKMGHKRLNTLSGGMIQKVSAALAFLFDPKVLILDEPTAGLDPVANEKLKLKLTQSINNNKLILITSHILSDLDEVTSHVVYLMDGKVSFYKSLEELRSETSESRLNRIIAQILNQRTYV